MTSERIAKHSTRFIADFKEDPMLHTPARISCHPGTGSYVVASLSEQGRPTTNTHFRDGDTDNDTESMSANKCAPPPNGDYRTQIGALRDSYALSAVVFQGISGIAPTTTDLSTQPGVANTYLSCTAYT
ncbi:unnamed protein product [Angiostrongylus costaricensis]|uniref:TEA domain-containing protein n=1 Tax=Angiostrongylus costaricensis TaxID=334426 RepID=A0A0R3PLY0_ANGCS|nr:unnamed protein product [Angiostrongylus costaricensis]